MGVMLMRRLAALAGIGGLLGSLGWSALVAPARAAFPGENGRIAFSSDREGNFDIHDMDPDGTDQKRLTTNAANDITPAFSPDGNRIAFWSFGSSFEIHTMNADGTDETNLTGDTRDGYPSYSPDGSKLAFVTDGDGNNNEIYVMNADGTGATRLTNNAASDSLPAYSPDGSKVAFMSDRDGNNEIYIMNADGSAETNLTNNAADDETPAYSPDGSKIAFTTDRDGNHEIYVMNADGSNATRLTTNPASESFPAFSPDGSKIAFTTDRDGNREIYVMNADGSDQTNLTHNDADDFTPSWGPLTDGPPEPPAVGPQWLLPGHDLSTAPTSPTSPARVAMNPAGDAIAVWDSYDGVNTTVQAASRPVGGAFSAPVDVSSSVGTTNKLPEVAIDPAGDVIVAWLGEENSQFVVQAAVRPAGADFSAPVDLTGPVDSAAMPHVAMDSAGDAIVIWPQSFVVEASVRPAGGSFSAHVPISAPGEQAFFPQVAMNASGAAIAIWQKANSGSVDTVRAALRPPGGAFAGPIDASGGEGGLHPQAAIDQAGDAIIVYEGSDGLDAAVRAVTRPAGGAFAAPVDVSTAGQPTPQAPEIAMNPAGDAVVSWVRTNGSPDTPQAATRVAGGPFSAPFDLATTAPTVSAPQVAMSPTGRAVAVWSRFNGSKLRAQGVAFDVGSSAPAPVTLSAAGRDASATDVAMDDDGDAVAVWVRPNGTKVVVQAAGYDGAGPRLHALSVPSTGTAGAPVSFSIAPLDTWSALGPTSWSFGDGATALGETLTHTYAHSGTFTVTSTATDVLTNHTSASRTISIAPAPVSGPPPPPPTAIPPPAPALPTVKHLRVRPSTLHAANSGPAIRTTAAHGGARVSYSLNVPSSVRFTIERATAGRRVGGHCVRGTAANRHHGRCTRFVRVNGHVTRARPSGTDRFTFTGRFASRRLKPHRYRLRATPTANGRTGETARASFRIVRAGA